MELYNGKPRFVQLLNPRSKRWVKVDRKYGGIVSHKVTPGPYKGIEEYKPELPLPVPHELFFALQAESREVTVTTKGYTTGLGRFYS